MTRPVVERNDAGFTLVELLVSIVIEAIIVGALGMAFVGILKGSASVNQSLSRSGDARIAAAYLISDARNSSGPEVSLTTSTCADPSPPVAGASLIVQFAYKTTAALSGTTVPDVVDYLLASNKLTRRECKNAALVSDRVVA
jgi:prepilin-type N-terminal cleavage/methylation domain-containing protein